MSVLDAPKPALRPKERVEESLRCYNTPTMDPGEMLGGGGGSADDSRRNSRRGQNSPEAVRALEALEHALATIGPTPQILLLEQRHLDALKVAERKPSVNLGAAASAELSAALIETKLEGLMEEIRKDTLVFLAVWKGTKVPRGAILLGQEITHTQNGAVYADGGEIIGTYDRIIEWGGPKKDCHALLIFANPPKVELPPELERPLPPGTARISSFEELKQHPGELIASSYDHGRSWHYFRMNTRQELANIKQYLGRDQAHAQYLDFECSSTITANTFKREIFRTTTEEEQGRKFQRR